MVSLSALDCAAKTEHLRVSAEHEEDAGEQRALQHRAGNGAQRLARLAAQRGGALKADKAEDGEHQRGPQRWKANALEPELVGIELQAEVDGQQDNSTIMMRLTETASIHSMTSAESLTSR